MKELLKELKEKLNQEKENLENDISYIEDVRLYNIDDEIEEKEQELEEIIHISCIDDYLEGCAPYEIVNMVLRSDLTKNTEYIKYNGYDLEDADCDYDNLEMDIEELREEKENLHEDLEEKEDALKDKENDIDELEDLERDIEKLTREFISISLSLDRLSSYSLSKNFIIEEFLTHIKKECRNFLDEELEEEGAENGADF